MGIKVYEVAYLVQKLLKYILKQSCKLLCSICNNYYSIHCNIEQNVRKEQGWMGIEEWRI